MVMIMLNHNEVIEKLTNKQKFALLTDMQSWTGPEMLRAGVPQVSLLTLESLMPDGYEGLTPSRLANSWDTDLIQRVARKTVTDADALLPGAKLMLTPAAKPVLHVYRPGLSEDPHLSGTLAAAFADGAHKAGSGRCPDGFYLTDSDVEQLDTEPDMTAIGELVLKPYMIAVQGKGCESILTDLSPLKGRYRNVNADLAATKNATEICDGAVRLCRPRTDAETLAAILDGKVVIKGGSSALESAYEKYRYIVKAIEDEIVTVEDLDEAMADGSAISDEMLNRAVARVLDFAHALSVIPKQETENTEITALRKTALTASAVLLKNDKELLPIKPKHRVAIIGRPAASPELVEAACTKAGLKVIGRMDGYDPTAATGGVDTEGVCALAKKADRVLVFLGCSAEESLRAVQNREMTIPAVQAELLHALGEYRSKTVTVLDCAHAVDMSFATDTAALLLMSVGGEDGAEALADLLTGKACPSGKLASTLYENPSEHFARLKQCKNAEKNKVGLFVGYRHYDSADIAVSFPFGHGLSYTTFKYSNLKIGNGQLSFTVKNTGSVAGAEIAQIYLGKAESARLRPRKELFSFTKLFLRAGEQCRVTVDLSLVAFYNAETDAWVREAGEYTVYVGSSVKDIRLTKTFPMEGEAYTPCEAKASDYLQTHSNILSDGYVADVKKPRRPRKHWVLKTVGVLLSVLAVVLAIYGFIASGILLQMIPDTLPSVLSEVIISFVSTLATDVVPDVVPEAIAANLGMYCLMGAAACLVLAILLFILNAIRKLTDRKKLKIAEETERRNAELLEAAEEKSFNAIEELFAEEFDTAAEAVETVAKETAYVDDTAHYIDLNYTLPDAARDLEQFMQARGMEFSTTGAMQLISALAASRLTAVDVMGVDRESFYRALAEYLGSPLCIETACEESAATHLMYRKAAEGGYVQTALADLTESAKANPNTIHLAVLRGVRAEALPELFMPYVKYFSNPLRENRIIVKEPVATFTLPENLWFMVEPAEGESLASAQASILRSVAYVQLSLSDCEPTDPITSSGLGYYQFDHFIQQRKGRFVMDEDLWKKIDELEAFVASHAAFHIGNKQWLQLEKYLAVLSVAETEPYAALDRALYVNLLPVITSLLQGKIPTGEKDLAEALEQIFGEEKLPLCTKAVRSVTASAETAETAEPAEPAELSE